MQLRSALAHRPSFIHSVLPLLLMAFCIGAQGQVPLTQISTDSFTNSDSQHATEVEASTFANGNTIVTAFQEGRYDNFGGSSGIGFATSTDGGSTWTNGTLPDLSTQTGGSAQRISDPSVAYDAKHGVWLIATLPVFYKASSSKPMLVSRSTDGGLTWKEPIAIGINYSKPDKTWLSCDNTATSPYYGNCYAEWDNNGAGDILYFAVSSDGGKTFGSPVQPSGAPADFAVQPLAQPNGTVIAVGASAFDDEIEAVTSTDGGSSFSANVNVTDITHHTADGSLRDLVLPTSAVDAGGTVYTVWQDCRFVTNCTANNLVLATTTDGSTWSAVTQIPIGASGTTDVFLPGLAVEPGTSGSSAHLGLTFYYYTNADCGIATCELEEGYVSSTDGGATWSALTTIAGPMTNNWFPTTNQGFMPGDYESLVFVNGAAIPVLGVAASRTKGEAYNVSMNIPTTPLTDGVGIFSGVGIAPVPDAHSDRPKRTVPVCDNCDDDE